MSSILENYISQGFYNIEGWCNINMLWIASELHSLQLNLKIAGGAGEIGVHHGKFFIPLALLKSADQSIAIDVFSLPFGNVDKSGKGDYEIFSENLKKFISSDMNQPLILEGDSLHITSDKIFDFTNRYGKLSMFSIDGSHTREHTYNDILLAEQFLTNGGIIFVDDYYNPGWPGVHEGVAKYFFFHAYKFVPLCFAFQKLILVDLSYHKFYFGNLQNILKNRGYKLRHVKQYGFDSLSVGLQN